MILSTHKNPCLNCLCALYLLEKVHGKARIEFVPKEVFMEGHLSCMEVYQEHFQGRVRPVSEGNVTYLFGNATRNSEDARRLALVSYCDADGRGDLKEPALKYGTLKSAIMYARDATLVNSQQMYQAFKFLADKIIGEDLKYLLKIADQTLIEANIVKDLGVVE